MNTNNKPGIQNNVKLSNSFRPLIIYLQKVTLIN